MKKKYNNELINFNYFIIMKLKVFLMFFVCEENIKYTR